MNGKELQGRIPSRMSVHSENATVRGIFQGEDRLFGKFLDAQRERHPCRFLANNASGKEKHRDTEDTERMRPRIGS
jgi:hypothetical protein